MPRLFTGLEIPGSLNDYFASLRSGLQGARFIDPSDYHLTLRFIGDVGYDLANDLADMLGHLSMPRFSLKISTFSSFGKDEAPHSLVATVAPCQILSELQHDHDRLAKKLGLPADARKFSPHVTLARLKPSAAPYIGDWLVQHSPPLSKPFEMTRFALFSSRHSTGGGPYVVEKTYPLERNVLK